MGNEVVNGENVRYYTFQVISGEHQGRTRVYKKGEIFRSRHPLDKLFSNKFVKLPDAPLTSDDDGSAIGTHLNGSYGDIYANEETNANQSNNQVNNDAIQAPREFDFKNATNVTHMFPVAKDAKLSVYKDSSGGFAVTDEEASNPINLADDILPTKAAVRNFLKDFEVGPDDGKQD